MAFDASGTFTRLRGNNSWKGDATAGTKIKSDLHDNNDNDIANGLSETLTKTGKSLPVVDIPWGGFKITNLGNPTQPGDAANKIYVDNLPGWPKSKNIEGADLDGRLNFTAPSGVNGITWTYADLSWVARHSVANKYSNYLTMNSGVAPNTTGDPVGDVFIIDEVGRITNNGRLSSNLVYDGAKWRTIDPGTATSMTYTGGSFTLQSNDTATITNKYAEATLRTFGSITSTTGNTFLTLDKQKSATGVYITGSMAGKTRWRMDLGNATAETATDRVGSDFYLYSWNNAGAAAVAELSISRSAHTATFAGTVSVGSINPSAYGIHPGAGVMGKTGQSGGYTGHWHNSYWNGTYYYLYVNDLLIGAVAWQCDYRIKKNVTPLGSMWEKVKALNPVSFQQRAYDIFVDNDEVRWGFLAHELQERLLESAAVGRKDEPNVIQNPDPMAVIAALTKALQEAMARIEALEAA